MVPIMAQFDAQPSQFFTKQVESVSRLKLSFFLRFTGRRVMIEAKKLNAFGINIDLDHSDPTESEIDSKNCYFFAQATTLLSLICGLLCPNCQMLGVNFSVDVDAKHWFAAKAKISCSYCKNFTNEGFLCEPVESASKNAAFDTNIRSALAFRGIG